MIGAVENAILARLRAAGDAGALGYRYHSLETYPVNWDEYLKDKGNLRAPAAWATFAGWGANSDGEISQPLLPATFGLVVMAENQRNEQATRHGDPVDQTVPGSYQMIIDAISLLAGDDLGVLAGPIVIGACQHVRPPAALRERKVSMLALELRTKLQFEPLDLDDGPVDFTHFHADWDVPPIGAGRDGTPIGGVPWTGPDPDNADAADDIFLPGASA